MKRQVILIWTAIGIFLFVFQSSNCLDVHTSPQEFCYDDPECGPNSKKWTGICHNGTRQSPLNLISPRRSQPVYASVPIRQLKADYFFIQNNGHTINVNFWVEGHGVFPGYGLSTHKYKFENLHFHWSNRDDIGSEHLIEGQSYSMEIHLVHYNSKYRSVSEAIASGNSHAVAVMAIFLQVSDSVGHNRALAPIIKNLFKVHDKHSYWEKITEPLDLTELIPRRNEWMYHYKGSLTTPGCNEHVNWYIFERPTLISHSDVKAFRKMHDGNQRRILDNHRPVQPPHGRRIDLMLLE